MRWSKSLNIVGAHAEGEVGRVVTGGIIDLPGATMLDKLRYLVESDDSLIRFTLFEPRGCAQMSVNLLLPPTRDEAHAAFIPLQPDGPHAMSGSNAMCVITVLLETGVIPMVEPSTEVVLDTPAGLVTALATCRDGKCESVALDFVPSFVEHRSHPLEIEGYGSFFVDVAYGGCYFALVDAKQFDFQITPDEARDLVALGTQIAASAKEQISVCHPSIPSLNTVEYAQFCAQGQTNARNGTVIFPGRMDRSPCGTGTAARLALMHERGEVSVGDVVEFRSIINSRFQAQVIGETKVGNQDAITTRISGRAWIFDLHTMGMDPSDPFAHGYTLNDTWGMGATETHA